jgi:hypothetical protein
LFKRRVCEAVSGVAVWLELGFFLWMVGSSLMLAAIFLMSRRFLLSASFSLSQVWFVNAPVIFWSSAAMPFVVGVFCFWVWRGLRLENALRAYLLLFDKGVSLTSAVDVLLDFEDNTKWLSVNYDKLKKEFINQ